MTDFHEEIFYAPMRFAWMVPFPSAAMPSILEEAINDGADLPEEIKSLIDSSDYNMSDYHYEGLLGEAYFRGVKGFIGVAETPVMRKVSENAHSFSWGYYHTKMLFAPTCDELMTKALAWVDEVRA